MKLTAKLPMKIAMGLEDDSFPFGAILAYFKRLAAIFQGSVVFLIRLAQKDTLKPPVFSPEQSTFGEEVSVPLKKSWYFGTRFVFFFCPF